jgi:hypothetical protein
MLLVQGLRARHGKSHLTKENDMDESRRKWGFVVVGAVAVLTLGVIAVASAAGSQTATPSPSASAQAGQAHSPDFDGDGPHGDADGGRIHGGGPGDIAEALANLSGKDVSEIMTRRAAGTSFAEIAKAEGVSTEDLLAEATRIETAELDAAVKAGTMTSAERTQELSGLQARLEAAVTETGALPAHGGPGHDGGRGHGGGGDIAEALAKLSGTDVGTIMEKRAAGTSFAQIAKAEGVATDRLLAEATRIETAELDAAVKAGTMTAAERTQILSGLQAHLKEELAETHTLPADGGHGVGRDGDGPQGSPGAGQSGGAAESGTTGTGYFGGSSDGLAQTY